MDKSRATVNITPAERVGRAVVCLVALVVVDVVIPGVAGAVALALLMLLGLAGLDLVVAGASGHCPLHKKPGRVSLAVKGRTS